MGHSILAYDNAKKEFVNNHLMTMWGEGMDGKEHKFMEASMMRKM